MVYLSVYIIINKQKTQNYIAKLCAFFVIITLTFSLVGCGGVNNENDEIILFGSPVSLYIVSDGYSGATLKSDKLYSLLYDLSEDYEKTFSVEESSEISVYNTENAPKYFEISKRLFDALTTSKDLYEKTGGAFNPQVKLLVDLWGFSKRYKEIGYYPTEPYDRERLSDGGFSLPSSEYVEAFKYLSDFSLTDFYISEGKYYLIKPDLHKSVGGRDYYSQLDFAAIAKGMFVDEAVKLISESGAESFYLSAGGSSLYLSDNSGEAWNLKIVDPFSKNREPLLSLPVKNKYVSTSGTYENSYAVDGKTYCHIIDAKKGAPTDSDLVSVTVIGDSGAKTDALSTALLITGSENALDFLEKAPEFDYVLIKTDGTVISNLESAITYC